jgi:hypothetical protein
MQKLFQFNPQDNTFEVRRGGEVFYSARVYQERELRPHFNEAEFQTQFEYLGEGPPDCDKIRTKPELAKRAEALCDWIHSPIARKLGWEHEAGHNGVGDLDPKNTRGQGYRLEISTPTKKADRKKPRKSRS